MHKYLSAHAHTCTIRARIYVRVRTYRNTRVLHACIKSSVVYGDAVYGRSRNDFINYIHPTTSFVRIHTYIRTDKNSVWSSAIRLVPKVPVVRGAAVKRETSSARANLSF